MQSLQEEWDAAVPAKPATDALAAEWEEAASPSQVQQETEELGVWDRYKEDVGKHGMAVLGRYGVPGATLFGASAGVRAIGDAMVTGAMEGYDAVDEYLPPWLREGIATSAKTAGEYIAKADQAVKSTLTGLGVSEVDQRMLGAAFDLAALGPGSTKNLLKQVPAAERGRVRRMAEHFRRTGVTQDIAEKQQKILRRIAPDNPKDFDSQTLYREGPDPLRQRSLDVGETSPLQDQATALARIKGLDPQRSYVHMSEKVTDEIRRAATQVDDMVAKNNKKVDMGGLMDDMLSSLDDLEGDPWYDFLPGDAKKSADDFIEKSMQIVQDSGKDLVALKNARREIDKLYTGIKSNIDPGNPRNGAEVAWRHVRNELNDALRARLPTKIGDDVYDLNQHMHHLYKAQDTLLPRIPQESVNALYRTAGYLRSHALLPSTALALAATAQFFAPMAPAALTAAAAGGSAMAAYKFARSAAGRKALSKTLRGLDEVMRITKDPKALAEMRADRLVLLDLMRAERQDESETED